MVHSSLLQQQRDIFPAVPTNSLLLFLVLSFVVPVIKFVLRRIRAQIEELLAAANQDDEDLEISEQRQPRRSLHDRRSSTRSSEPPHPFVLSHKSR